MSPMISFEFALLGFSADSHLHRCLSWKIHLMRFSKKEIVVFAALNITKDKRNPSPANISNTSNHHYDKKNMDETIMTNLDRE